MENTTDESQERLVRYLEDAWAVEAGLVVNLKEMADDANDSEVRNLFMERRIVTMQQKDRLEARLKALGKEPSGGKGILSQVVGKIGDALHVSHDNYDKTAQKLFLAYGSANFEAAVYEAMESYADMIGDTDTAALARMHKGEEQEAVKAIWPHISRVAKRVSEVVPV